jgi:hypothetical protein
MAEHHLLFLDAECCFLAVTHHLLFVFHGRNHMCALTMLLHCEHHQLHREMIVITKGLDLVLHDWIDNFYHAHVTT